MFTAPRNLTEDGGVVFATKDQLVAGDQTSAADVYLYDKGRLSLLSSGQGDDDSYVADNSDDGRDIFFMTRSPLVGQDNDPAELDLYDARVGGASSSHRLPHAGRVAAMTAKDLLPTSRRRWHPAAPAYRVPGTFRTSRAVPLSG